MAETSLNSVETPPITDWTHPPKLSDLKLDMASAKSAHDLQMGKIQVWLDNLNVEGKAKVSTPDGHSKIVPKLIRKQAEWRYPALSEPFLNNYDLFSASPTSWEDKRAALQNALVLNFQFNNRINKVQFFDEFVRTAVDEGTVITRVGWDFEEEEYTAKEPVYSFIPDMSMDGLFQELMQFKEENSNGFATDVPMELQAALDKTIELGIPMRPSTIGEQEVTKTRTIKNCPTLDICDFRNVTIDPTCKGDVDKAGFVIYSFESSLSILKKDKRYKNLDKILIDSVSVLAEPDHATNDATDFNFADNARKKFVVYEYWGYWDIDGSGLTKSIVASWVGDVLVRMEENPFPDKKPPFVVAQYLPTRKKIYGEPDGHLLEDNQKVVGAVTRGMIDLMGKSANSQTGTRKDALDTTNRRKFEKGQDYEFNAHVHPEQVFYTHKFPEIPNSAQFMLQLQNFDAESMTGVKAFSNNGLSGDAFGEVAAGIRGTLDAASKREIAILRRLAAGVIKIGKKIVAMNGEFLEEDEVIRVTNDKFIKVRLNELQGDFDLELKISTAEEDNAKAQELAFMLQTMGPSADPEVTRMIQTEIARLRKMPDLAKKIEEYQPKPDPMQQEIQRLTIEKLMAEIAEIQSRPFKNQAGANLDMAKIGTEQAKARQLGSTADKTDLDFVEQESGVTQERNLQQQRAQAEGNMELKREEARLKAKEGNRTQLADYLANKKK